MLKINKLPKNKDKFVRLIDFLIEVLNVCKDINVQPVLDGSLAVFLYTKNKDIVVNDIDLSYPEKDYPRIESALIKSGFNAKIQEWHVLQVRKDDLKVEFSDTDYWYPGVPIEHQEYLVVGEHKLKILKLDSLISFYEIGLKNLKLDEEKQQKYQEVKTKYEMLKKVKNQNFIC